MLVTDASVLVAAVADGGGRGAQAREAMRGAGEAHVPHLADLEVASVLYKLVFRGSLDAPTARAAVADFAEMPLIRHPHAALLPRVWELRPNLTAYDAAYVALAETLGVTLLTGDRRLETAPGLRCDVRILPD
ncbi:MAG: type II toxin-antitoxin system VapC family toxin [Jiangellaceae bacterium]